MTPDPQDVELLTDHLMQRGGLRPYGRGFAELAARGVLGRRAALAAVSAIVGMEGADSE